MAAPEENAEAAGNNKRKIVIIALVALLALGGGGAAFMLNGGDSEAATADAVDGATRGDPVYIALDPAFVVNFQDKSQHTKFLKAELNVVTYEDGVPEAVAKHMPAIRNDLVMLFSRQIYEDLLAQEGKEALRAEALAEVQAVIEKQTGKPGVEDLFFTSFVMQ